jgi:hypothetical protein
MRILNIVYNAEIKYQQHIKLINYRHRYLRSNIDPKKTHKGKTSEREILLFLRSEEMSFTTVNNIRNLI